MNNYVSRGDALEIDAFSQDTARLGHARLKEELSKIMKVRVPDICLSSSNAKDSVIYTNLFGASVWYKSCGVTDLPSKYEPTYVLTGDTEKLYFYYLLLATIFVLKQKDKSFQSVRALREKFCREYIDIYQSEETLEEIIELFNLIFKKESDRGLIRWVWGSNKERYVAHFCEIDSWGFIPKTDAAEYFADVVLSKIKTDEPVSHRRTLKQDDNK